MMLLKVAFAIAAVLVIVVWTACRVAGRCSRREEALAPVRFTAWDQPTMTPQDMEWVREIYEDAEIGMGE
jgi:hypothetical protein